MVRVLWVDGRADGPPWCAARVRAAASMPLQKLCRGRENPRLGASNALVALSGWCKLVWDGLALRWLRLS